MGNDLFAQLEKLEVIVFFAGYSMLYLLIALGTDVSKGKIKRYFIDTLAILPMGYALSGALFVGWILKNWYGETQLGADPMSFQLSTLRLVGLLSLLFWIPIFRKYALLSLCHSLFFFTLIFRDWYAYLSGDLQREVMLNDRNIFIVSLLLNFVLVVFIILFRALTSRFAPNRR